MENDAAHEGLLILVALLVIAVLLVVLCLCRAVCRKSTVQGRDELELPQVPRRSSPKRNERNVDLEGGRLRATSSEELQVIQQMLQAKDERNQLAAEENLLRLAQDGESHLPVTSITDIDLTADDELRAVQDFLTAESSGTPTDKLAATQKLFEQQTSHKTQSGNINTPGDVTLI